MIFPVSMKSFLLVPFLIIVFYSGCAHNPARPDAVGGASMGEMDSTPLLADNDLTAEARLLADSALSMLTLEERVGQCFMPSVLSISDSVNLDKLRRYIVDFHVGGIVLLRGDLRSAAVMAGMGASARVPLITAIDAEWGLGMRLEDAPGFPRNGNIAAQADEQLLFDYGREVARECRRVGINMVLGPVVDVVGNPGGVIGDRSFGGDPIRVADLGVAYSRGLESGGVLSVAKHFPGHGASADDSHVSLPVLLRGRQELDSIDLYPFRSYIDAALNGIMVGHLAVPAVDSLMLPAAVSPAVIGGLLRDSLGFRGLVLTDALNMGGVAGYGAGAALEAGADIVVGPADTGAEIRNVMDLLKTGKMRMSVIDAHCRRILFYKFLTGLHRRRRVSLEGLREEVRGEADSISVRLS